MKKKLLHFSASKAFLLISTLFKTHAQDVYLSPFVSQQFTGYYSGLELSKNYKKHNFHIALGFHQNTTIDDTDKWYNALYRQGESHSFLQSLGLKFGYKYYLGKGVDKQYIRFYPFVEHHIAYLDFKNQEYGNLRIYALNTITNHLFINFNFGMGVNFHLNDKFSISSQMGLGISRIFYRVRKDEYDIEKDIILYRESYGIDATVWQVGVNIKM